MKSFWLVLVFFVAARVSADQLIHSITFQPVGPNDKKPQLLGDRFEYWADDLNGQFYVQLDTPTNSAPRSLRITLKKEGAGKPVAELVQPHAPENKAHFLVHTAALKPGRYEVSAVLLDAENKQLGEAQSFRFARSEKRHPIVPIPTTGIPIQLEEQSILPDATWPVRVGVPLPVGAVTDTSRLALFEDGKPVEAQIKPVARWCPQGSIQWAHVDFLGKYSGGKPADYRLKVRSTDFSRNSAASTSPMPPEGGTTNQVNQTDDQITVDTGSIRFIVNRKRFAGIEAAWFDATGSGKYDEANPVVKGTGGPYLVDGRIIRFDAANDTNAVVVVEEQGPVRVTIRAEGWYVNPEGRVDPLCKFVTRITAFTGQPFLRVSQHTIITFDTRQYRLKDVGFHVASRLGENYRLGADGATKEGALPASPQTIFLHQDRYDHFRTVGPGTNVTEGARSDGWFTLASTNPAIPNLTVFLRDIWQKFPKEVELGREGLTLHFWPKHGHRSFAPADELDLKNIYKFWCFHQGALLDLTLPNDYYEKFAGDYASGTFECRPEHALNGNGQGLAIGNEFLLLFHVEQASSLRPSEASNESQAGSSRHVADLARLFQRDPAARASPEWNAGTGALGKIAAVDRAHFAVMEEAVEQGWLSHTRCIERGNEYGMWIWPDTHTYWNVEGNHAELHRVWHNSHYHEVGQTWLMYYRSGSPELLRWARANTDHWMNIGTVNHADFLPDGRPRFMFHLPGAMYHCKGHTPWGNEDYGMMRRDDHAGLFGHYTDPDAFLWCWYLDGNPRAKDVYDLWSDSIRKYGAPLTGTRREANTSLATAVTYYQATWDADILPSIHGLGRTLRTAEPLEKQQPGPMWHPLWVTRYYELTRDPEYVSFILENARHRSLENAWLTALAALAHDLSGDKSYLTEHFESVGYFPNRFFHAPGDPYDWYGAGPGPIGDGWGAYLCWGHFLYALDKAKITDATPERLTRFGYLVGGDPALTVYALETNERPFTLTFSASSLGGDLTHCHVRLDAPSGKEAVRFTVPPYGGPSSWTEKRDVAADGETGLYRFTLLSSPVNVRAPLTDLPYEATTIPKNLALATSGLYGFLGPSDETVPVELSIASAGRAALTTPCNLIVTDGEGKVIVRASLFQPRKTPPITLTLDPKQHKLPWKLDVYGAAVIEWRGEAEQLFLSPSDDALQAIIATLGR